MVAFIARRLIVSIPVLLGIVAVTFLLAHSIPGDPCRAMLGERASEAVCNAYKVRMGLDEPLGTQFLIYLGNLLQGDLGTSLRYSRTITDLLTERLPVTLELGLVA